MKVCRPALSANNAVSSFNLELTAPMHRIALCECHGRVNSLIVRKNVREYFILLLIWLPACPFFFRFFALPDADVVTEMVGGAA